MPKGQGAASRAPVGLDADAVVAAALELIDEHGAWAFTIRRLSERLGVSAPTIYWHVGSKTELFERIVDRVITDMSVTTTGPWEERLHTYLSTAREHLLAHPGAAELMGSVHSKALGAWSAEALDIMVAAGFDETTAMAYARTAMLQATSTARSEARSLRSDFVERVPGHARRLRVRPDVLAEDLDPMLARMTTYDLDEQHELATRIFVDGIRAAVDRLAENAAPRRRR